MAVRRRPLQVLNTMWKDFIPFLDQIIGHLEDAGDTMVEAAEILNSVDQLVQQFRSSDFEPGSAAARQLLRKIDNGIELSSELVAVLDAPGRRYYSSDQFHAQYVPGGHLWEANYWLRWMIRDKPSNQAMLAFLAYDRATDDDTLEAVEDAIQKAMDSLTHATWKMKSVSLDVSLFLQVLLSSPRTNCILAGNHARGGAKDIETVTCILMDLGRFFVNQSAFVKVSFGYGKPPYENHGPGSTTKKIEIPNERICVIVGKEGGTIRRLRVHSGAKIILPHDMDVLPGSQTRSVYLCGTPDQISRAERLITDVLAEADNGISRKFSPPHPSGHDYIIPPFSATKKIEIPNGKVSVIIGDYGETLRHVHIQSGAKIVLANVRSGQPCPRTRSVDLWGTPDQIRRAEQLITDVLGEADAGILRKFCPPHHSAKFLQMQIANDKACLVIGEGGKTVQEMQVQSGARIQVVPLDVPDGYLAERTLYIDGTADQIAIAKQLISEVTSENASFNFALLVLGVVRCT